MSTSEREPAFEQKSSVKVSQNAKGEAQVEVKVYDGTEAEEVERIRVLALGAYISTVSQVRA